MGIFMPLFLVSWFYELFMAGNKESVRITSGMLKCLISGFWNASYHHDFFSPCHKPWKLP